LRYSAAASGKRPATGDSFLAAAVEPARHVYIALTHPMMHCSIAQETAAALWVINRSIPGTTAAFRTGALWE